MTKYTKLAAEVGKLVDEKNKAYGNSFSDTGDFLTLLYPNGIPPEKYGDMLCIVRIFDKLKRIATKKDAFGESPYQDIVGYGLLGLVKDNDSREIAEMMKTELGYGLEDIPDFDVTDADPSDIEDAQGNEEAESVQVATPYEEYKEEILRRNSTLPAPSIPEDKRSEPTVVPIGPEAQLMNITNEMELVQGVQCAFCNKEILPGVPKSVMVEGVTVAHPECYATKKKTSPVVTPSSPYSPASS